MIARRSFLTGLISLIAAPAVVKASSLMPIRQPRLLTINEITRECIRLFTDTNEFLVNYDNIFAIANNQIGTTLRIRLPNDYRILS